MTEKKRCTWGKLLEKDFYRDYHDKEWGVPVHDDRKHYEYLFLESMSCGLSWELMLKKRDIFRQCFADFDYETVAGFTEKDIQKIWQTEGMIHSKRKIEGEIHNAQVFCKTKEEYGSFDQYIWSFTKGKTYIYRSHQNGWVTRNELSDMIANDLKSRGFKYVGTVIIYSHLQAIGIINDHNHECFRYKECAEMADVEMKE